MLKRKLTQKLLTDTSFWKGKQVLLPRYDRQGLPVTAVCFSAGRMAYAHTGDILQDLLNQDPDTGLIAGVETYAKGYVDRLASSDYLVTQLIFGEERNEAVAKIQGAVRPVLFADSDLGGAGWWQLIGYARDPRVRFATINAPEGVYGVAYNGGDFAEPVSEVLQRDMTDGTINSDPAKWTAFALERFRFGLRFAFVSCTNFSANGHHTGAVLRTVARAWEKYGHAPEGFLDYLCDPSRFSFPNCMIDRIAVAPDERTEAAMEALGLDSVVVVTEKARYWVVEDCFAAGRPEFDKAEGVMLAGSYEQVKRFEDMKIRILNMSHSVIAGLGVLLGYRGSYGIHRAMHDKDITDLIGRIINTVISTLEAPESASPEGFARDCLARLRNPNIPDDPMRIALNASVKMRPRFLDTYFAGVKQGIDRASLDVVLLPVAGFFRYTLGIDDRAEKYDLADDPIRDGLRACGRAACLGDVGSAAAFHELISDPDIMGENLYRHHDTGRRLQRMVSNMLVGEGAVRKTIREYLGSGV